MKRLIGSNKAEVDTVKGWFPTDEQKQAQQAIEELATNPDVPLVKYGGGARDNVHLTEAYGAVEYLYENDGLNLQIKTIYEEQYDAVVENAGDSG